jgi:predicted transcriptional regulator
MPTIKRSKADIYQDVLDLLCKEGAIIGTASPSRVASRANLPYMRFQKVLEHLIDNALVRLTDNGILITEKGLYCLRELRQANSMLKKLGLDF